MAETTYVVVDSAVGPYTQGEFVTLDDFQRQSGAGVDQARLDQLVERGSLREATEAELKAGSASHSDRDATFVEDQAADENRARIAEMQRRLDESDGKLKGLQDQIDALAEATATRVASNEQQATDALQAAGVTVPPDAGTDKPKGK